MMNNVRIRGFRGGTYSTRERKERERQTHTYLQLEGVDAIHHRLEHGTLAEQQRAAPIRSGRRRRRRCRRCCSTTDADADANTTSPRPHPQRDSWRGRGCSRPRTRRKHGSDAWWRTNSASKGGGGSERERRRKKKEDETARSRHAGFEWVSSVLRVGTDSSKAQNMGGGISRRSISVCVVREEKGGSRGQFLCGGSSRRDERHRLYGPERN